MEDSQYKPMPQSRTDLGYEWNKIDTKEAVGMLQSFLERVEARALVMDVYASNGIVYRNIVFQLPGVAEFPVAEDISIQFNRDGGRMLNVHLDH